MQLYKVTKGENKGVVLRRLFNSNQLEILFINNQDNSLDFKELKKELKDTSLKEISIDDMVVTLEDYKREVNDNLEILKNLLVDTFYDSPKYLKEKEYKINTLEEREEAIFYILDKIKEFYSKEDLKNRGIKKRFLERGSLYF